MDLGFSVTGINNRIAVRLGYSVQEHPKGYVLLRNGKRVDSITVFAHEHGAWASVPDFYSSYKGIVFLKKHMRDLGYHYRVAWGTDGASAYVDTRGPAYCIGESYKQDTEEAALCLAFLDAVEG